MDGPPLTSEQLVSQPYKPCRQEMRQTFSRCDWLQQLLMMMMMHCDWTVPERDGDTETSKQQIGHHADDRHLGQGDEDGQGDAEGCGGRLWLFPAEQLQSCGSSRTNALYLKCLRHNHDQPLR